MTKMKVYLDECCLEDKLEEMFGKEFKPQQQR